MLDLSSTYCTCTCRWLCKFIHVSVCVVNTDAQMAKYGMHAYREKKPSPLPNISRTATEFVFGSVRQRSAMFGTVLFGSDVRDFCNFEYLFWRKTFDVVVFAGRNSPHVRAPVYFINGVPPDSEPKSCVKFLHAVWLGSSG